MKKRTTKIAAALFAATLAVTGTGLGAITANAATITITNKEEGHTYKAYQLFIGDVTGNKVSNVKKGANLNLTAALVSEFNTQLGLTGDAAVVFNADDLDGTAQNIVSALAAKQITSNENTTVAANAEAISALFAKYTTGTPTDVSYDKDKKNYKTGNILDGYYIVKEEGTLTGKNKAYSEFLLQVAGDATVVAKSEIPTVNKQVADVTTNGVGSDWSDAADYAIGDTIAYKFDGTLASNYDNYNEYYYEFVDTFYTGLDFTGNVKVYVNSISEDTEIQGYTVTPETPAENTHYDTMSVKFSDLKKATLKSGGLANIKNTDHIIVTYTAKLNDNAKINYTENDKTGNWNKVKLVYSNNPTATGTGEKNPKGVTPEDQVTVFTYKVDALKTGSDTDGAGLDSATYGHAVFSVSKGSEVIGYGQTETNGNVTFYTKNSVTLAEDSKSITIPESAKVLTVPQGTYTVSELNAPNGYKKADNFTVTVSPVYKENATAADTTVPTIESLNVTLSQGASASVSGTTVTIIDQPESALPITGDSGRALYYAFGGMVAIAALLYLLREKKNA